MKVVVCAAVAPFEPDYHPVLEPLASALTHAGHGVETVRLPFAPEPQLALRQMAAYRWIDVRETADRLVCVDAPAHLLLHPRKSVWFTTRLGTLHNDWERIPPAPGLPGRGLEEAVSAIDAASLREAAQVFATSDRACSRLARRAGITAEVLRVPAHARAVPARADEDTVLSLAPLDPAFRQHLLVDALGRTQSDVRLRLAGGVGSPEYAQTIERQIAGRDLQHRVTVDDQPLDSAERAHAVSVCLAVAHLPCGALFQDPFAAEAAYASKPVLTTLDAGAPLEYVQDGHTGWVAAPDPPALAAVLDRIFLDSRTRVAMGDAARARYDETWADWTAAAERLVR